MRALTQSEVRAERPRNCKPSNGLRISPRRRRSDRMRVLARWSPGERWLWLEAIQEIRHHLHIALCFFKVRHMGTILE